MARSSTTGRGNGAGYGGPRKGAGNGAKKRDFSPGTNAQGHNQHSPETRAALRREQAEQVKDWLFGIAIKTDTMTAVAAGNSFLDRVEGKPIARASTLDFTPDTLTDAQLAAIAAGTAQE